MLKVFILLLGLVVAGISCVNSTAVTQYSDEPINVQVGENNFKTIVRDDAFERSKGLSGTESLTNEEAMLFIFAGPNKQSFWMKNMKFPLDFIWIRDGIVIGVNEDIPHPDANDGKTARVGSPGPVDMVMEINAGQIKEQGIRIGESITIEKE
jgi:uncharacterized protein